MSSEYTRRSHLLNSSIQVGRYSASRSEESYASKLPTSGAVSTYLSSRSTETDAANDDFKNYDSLLRRIRAEQADTSNANGSSSSSSYLATSPSRYAVAGWNDGPRESFLHSRHQELMKSRRLLDNSNYLGATAGIGIAGVGNGSADQHELQSQQQQKFAPSMGDGGWRPTYSVRNIPVRSLEEVRETIAIRRQYYRERLFGKNDEESTGENTNAEGISAQEGAAAIISEAQSAGNEEKVTATDLEQEKQVEPLSGAENSTENSRNTQEQNGPGDHENEKSICNETEVPTSLGEPVTRTCTDLTEDKPAPDFKEGELSTKNPAPTETNQVPCDNSENVAVVTNSNLELDGSTVAENMTQPEQTPEAITEIPAQIEHTPEIMTEVKIQPEQAPEVKTGAHTPIPEQMPEVIPEITTTASAEPGVITETMSQPEQAPEIIVESSSQFEQVTETTLEIIPEPEQKINTEENSSTTADQTLPNIKVPSQDTTQPKKGGSSTEATEGQSEIAECIQVPTANIDVLEESPQSPNE